MTLKRTNPTSFSDLVSLCQRLEATGKRGEKIRLIAMFLPSLKEDEVSPAVFTIVGSIFAPSDPRTLDVSWRIIERVKSNIKWRPSDRRPLTILDVQDHFTRMALLSGRGAQGRRRDLLADLFARSTLREARYIEKIILGEMRHGVGEGVMMQAIAEAAGVDLGQVQRAYGFSGDLGEVAQLALKGEIERLCLRLFRPIQPMLAQLALDFNQVFAEHGGRTALEYKFDGARVQIHKQRAKVKIFSRRLIDVTRSLPEIAGLIKDAVTVQRAILEGEVLAMGQDRRPLPFQELMRRFRRIHDVGRIREEVPVGLYLFDLIYLEGESLIDAPYESRWRMLREICPSDLLATRVVTESVEEAEEFLRQALEWGHEGVMAKALGSSYTPGARGKKWFKIKPTEHLDLVILAADWGHGRRKGWLSNYHLAARDEGSGEFLGIGKTFKGLTDREFIELTRRLQTLNISQTDYTVYVRPQVVVEVAFNEIQRSPSYRSGFALRFARVTRIREEKSPQEADTMGRVRELYERQFERKSRTRASFH